MLSRIIYLSVLAALMITLALSVNTAFTQDWSKQQQEVWKNVQAYWNIASERNVDAYMAYFHDDYLGWNINTPLPSNKADVRKWLTHWWKKSTTTIYDIKPVGIAVFGNVAVVHYYYSMVITNEEGKDNNMSGNWTDILMKQGDKWVLIGDHGGNTEDD